MDKDLQKLLESSWRISDRNADPGVWLVLHTNSMDVAARDSAYSLLTKQGIVAEWQGTKLVVRCAGQGAPPDNYPAMCALLSEARGEDDFLDKLVGKVISFDYMAKLRMPQTQVRTEEIPTHYDKLNEYSPQSLVAHFEKTAAFLDIFKPDITVTPNRSRRPGFVTMRISLTERNTVERIEAALPGLYKELSVHELAPLPVKDKYNNGDVPELVRVFGASSSTHFPEGRGPYAYATRDQENPTYVVSFPTPYARDKGTVKCDTLMRKLSEGLGLNLVRSNGHHGPRYSQGSLGF